MPRFRDEPLNTIGEWITQLGVQKCPVCQSADSLAVYRTPAVLHIGGHFEREEGAERDLFANILFFAMLMCRLCGHTMFISSEHVYSGDEPILTLEPLD